MCSERKRRNTRHEYAEENRHRCFNHEDLCQYDLGKVLCSLYRKYSNNIEQKSTPNQHDTAQENIIRQILY